MSENKIIDLARYRKRKTQIDKKSDPLRNQKLSFEEKLQEFIHRPSGEPGSKEELIAIFEEEQQQKKEREDEE